jgi:hypothetical protein
MEALIDPNVSKAKFAREIEQYKSLEKVYCSRGWFLVKAEFPEVVVVFAAPKVTPPPVVIAAQLDFRNYDFWPPSVRFVNPFTRVPYKGSELPLRLNQQTSAIQTPSGLEIQAQPLIQTYGDDDVPFLCLQGVREYHEHPAHTGDSWLTHRARGRGMLAYILEQISKYGTDQISGYNFAINIHLNGLTLNPPPK